MSAFRIKTQNEHNYPCALKLPYLSPDAHPLRSAEGKLVIRDANKVKHSYIISCHKENAPEWRELCGKINDLSPQAHHLAIVLLDWNKRKIDDCHYLFDFEETVTRAVKLAKITGVVSKLLETRLLLSTKQCTISVPPSVAGSYCIGTLTINTDTREFSFPLHCANRTPEEMAKLIALINKFPSQDRSLLIQRFQNEIDTLGVDTCHNLALEQGKSSADATLNRECREILAESEKELLKHHYKCQLSAHEQLILLKNVMPGSQEASYIYDKRLINENKNSGDLRLGDYDNSFHRVLQDPLHPSFKLVCQSICDIKNGKMEPWSKEKEKSLPWWKHEALPYCMGRGYISTHEENIARWSCESPNQTPKGIMSYIEQQQKQQIANSQMELDQAKITLQEALKAVDLKYGL